MVCKTTESPGSSRSGTETRLHTPTLGLLDNGGGTWEEWRQEGCGCCVKPGWMWGYRGEDTERKESKGLGDGPEHQLPTGSVQPTSGGSRLEVEVGKISCCGLLRG